MPILLNPNDSHTDPFFDSARIAYQDLVMTYRSVPQWQGIERATHLAQSAGLLLLQYPRMTRRQAIMLKLSIVLAVLTVDDTYRYGCHEDYAAAQPYAERLRSYLATLRDLVTEDQILGTIPPV